METRITADDLPSSPVPMQPEIKRTAADMLNADYWLHATGWRDLIMQLNTAEGDAWLRAYEAFRARIENMKAHASARRRYAAFGWGVLAGLAAAGGALLVLWL